VALKTGDTLVQNGPRHAWRNPHEAACRLLTVSIGKAKSSAKAETPRP
jgi:hypothetical protein